MRGNEERKHETYSLYDDCLSDEGNEADRNIHQAHAVKFAIIQVFHYSESSFFFFPRVLQIESTGVIVH
jgi:hypothetical protein